MKKFIVAKQHDCIELYSLSHELRKTAKENILKNPAWIKGIQEIGNIHDDTVIEHFCRSYKIVFDRQNGLPFELCKEKYIQIQNISKRCIILKQYICVEFQNLPENIKEKARENLLEYLKRDNVDEFINDDNFLQNYCNISKFVFDIETGMLFCLDDEIHTTVIFEIQLKKI